MYSIAFVDLCSGSGSVALAAARSGITKVYAVDRDHSRLTAAAGKAATTITADIETPEGSQKVLKKIRSLKRKNYVVVAHASPECTQWSKAQRIHGLPDTAAAEKHTDAVLSLLRSCDAWTVENPSAEGHPGALWAHPKYKQEFPLKLEVSYCCYGAVYKKPTTIACSDPYTFLLLANWASTCSKCACPAMFLNPSSRQLKHAGDICSTRKEERIRIPAQLAQRLVEGLVHRAMQLQNQAVFVAATSQPCPGKVLGFSQELPPGVTPATLAGSDGGTQQQEEGPWFQWWPAGAQQQQQHQQQQQRVGHARKSQQQLAAPLPLAAQWVQRLPSGQQPADAVWEDHAEYMDYFSKYRVEAEVFQVRGFEVDQQHPRSLAFHVLRPHHTQYNLLSKKLDDREPETWHWADPGRFAAYMDHMRQHKAAAAAAAAAAHASYVSKTLQPYLKRAGACSTGAGAAGGAGSGAAAAVAEGAAAAGGPCSQDGGRQMRSRDSAAAAATAAGGGGASGQVGAAGAAAGIGGGGSGRAAPAPAGAAGGSRDQRPAKRQKQNQALYHQRTDQQQPATPPLPLKQVRQQQEGRQQATPCNLASQRLQTAEPAAACVLQAQGVRAPAAATRQKHRSMGFMVMEER